MFWGFFPQKYKPGCSCKKDYFLYVPSCIVDNLLFSSDCALIAFSVTSCLTVSKSLSCRGMALFKKVDLVIGSFTIQIKLHTQESSRLKINSYRT